MDIKEKQLAIFEHYGIECQLDMLTEECAELIKAVMKFKRNEFTEMSADYYMEMVEEMADVSNIIGQFEVGLSQIKEIIDCTKGYKVDRELERIKERENK